MSKNTLLCILCALAFLRPDFVRAETCGCDVSAARVAAYDALLLDPDVSVERHAPWGLPRILSNGAETSFFRQRYWITGYDMSLRVPRWVAYRLTRDDLQKRRRRTACFRPEPRLLGNARAPSCETYRRSGYDRGHMVPSADMTRSEAAMVNTYIFTNIAPQYARFNRGAWAALEKHVRTLARRHGEIYIVSGPVFDADDDGVPDRRRSISRTGSGVAVASHFFKVVVWRAPSKELVVRAWMLPHTNDKDISIAAGSWVSLARIEKAAGLDLMPALTTVMEQASNPDAIP